MILNSTPQNEAILSNVGQIGEFRIKNSAKAFSILSSGLYANKIRAIIRELSCNAVDSHVDAGKADTPFDVHLPNSLEPWFAIRDYGTGLTNDQVTNIYTTYFESTKTGSNDFIGALGLGSKSPFSYTDNFTVTAVKNGTKGIYTAFINEHGVPSVALMTEEASTAPAGVEVKFSVNDEHDFYKFRDEATVVYTHFKLRPVVSGYSRFQFQDLIYTDRDIIPGVHTTSGGHNYDSSIALMGNIGYPISVPNAEATLGGLRKLLGCNLVMEFEIGELDFQASREGLSYIPSTVAAIKAKLQNLNKQLVIHLADKADKISNLWERAVFLEEKIKQPLWSEAVAAYVKQTKFPLVNTPNHGNGFLKTFKMSEEDLAAKFNISVKGFSMHRGNDSTSMLRGYNEYNQTTKLYDLIWHFQVSLNSRFVFNDTKVGSLQRAKHHYKKVSLPSGAYSANIYVFEKADKLKPIDQAGFLNYLIDPPAAQSFLASNLDEKERAAGMGKNISILFLEDRNIGRWGGRIKQYWTRAGAAADFDKKETYYYLPMKGFVPESQAADVKQLAGLLKSSKLHDGKIYGVRKADIDFIKSQKNWINLDTLVTGKLAKLDNKLIMSLVKYSIDFKDTMQYNIVSLIDANSPYAMLYKTFSQIDRADGQQLAALRSLCEIYTIPMTTDLDKLVAKHTKEINAIKARYPLLDHLRGYGVEAAPVAEYVNCIDKMHNEKKVP